MYALPRKTRKAVVGRADVGRAVRSRPTCIMSNRVVHVEMDVYPSGLLKNFVFLYVYCLLLLALAIQALLENIILVPVPVK